MKIETKFNINDKVWIMFDNYAATGKIIDISAREFKDSPGEVHIHYGVLLFVEKHDNMHTERVSEEYVFGSSKELMDELWKEVMKNNLQE